MGVEKPLFYIIPCPTAKYIVFSSSVIQAVQLHVKLRDRLVVKQAQCVCVFVCVFGLIPSILVACHIFGLFQLLACLERGANCC